jgi:hypothetical protein
MTDHDDPDAPTPAAATTGPDGTPTRRRATLRISATPAGGRSQAERAARDRGGAAAPRGADRARDGARRITELETSEGTLTTQSEPDPPRESAPLPGRVEQGLAPELVGRLQGSDEAALDRRRRPSSSP